MRAIIKALSQYVGIVGLAGMPITIAAMHAHNEHEKTVLEQELRAKNPALGPHYDENASRITDPKHPFWTGATLIKQCPATHEFMYSYRGHKYVGSKDANGVVELDDHIDPDDMKVFCS